MPKNGQDVYARLAKICPTNEIIGDANRAKANEYSEKLKSDVDKKDKLIGKRKYERTKKNEEEKQDLPETKVEGAPEEVEEKPARRRAPRRKKQEEAE